MHSLKLKRQFSKRNREAVTAEVMPLIDMVFILLIFFMLSATFLKPVLKLDLPSASTSNEYEEAKHIVISINANHQVYINQESVPLNQVGTRTAQMLKGSSKDYDVVLSSDKAVRYEVFVKVIDQLKQHDIQAISLEHDG